MLKKFSALSAFLCVFAAPAFAEDLPDTTVDVTLGAVSNYIFRGADLHQGRAQQKAESYGSNTGEWAFQPSVTFNTPVGLYFNIWGSFAMAGREDQDTDYLWQTAPGGSDLIAANGADFSPVLSTYTLDKALAQNAVGGGLGGQYKEANGLYRADEVDLTLGYKTSTTAGNIGFGLVHYTGPNPKSKTVFARTNEVFLTYAFPFLTDVTFAYYTDIGEGTGSLNNNNYYNVSYGKAIEIAESTTLDIGAGAGYGVHDRLQGWQDVTGKIGVTAYGFSVAFNYVYRPDLRFFDTDNTSGTNEQAPAWARGLSTRGDGLIADPSRTTGFVNSAINSAVTEFAKTTSGDASYAYTPRQKLPKTLWFVSLGYTLSL